jgi:N-acetylglucosaminyl-diphospho-decaprenol L-rhamnosyltransferase
MLLRIVTVNFRTADLAIACLNSLADEVKELPRREVVVVDNGSEDGSAEKISDAIRQFGWGSWASILPAKHNSGFAVGNNAAIRPMSADDQMPDYVLLLNSDTVVRPGAVQSLIEFMKHNPKAGICGSRLEDPDGSPQRSAFLFPNIWSELNDGIHLHMVERMIPRSQIAPPPKNTPHKTDWVAGASLLIRREVLEQIGLLDEGYFMYYEEVDYCLRAKRAGWECWYVPQSRVVHLVGQASKINNPNMKPKRRPAYWFQSRRRFFRKNYGIIAALAADLAWMLGYGCYRLRRFVTMRPVREPPWFFWDFMRHTYLRQVKA